MKPPLTTGKLFSGQLFLLESQKTGSAQTLQVVQNRAPLSFWHLSTFTREELQL